MRDRENKIRNDSSEVIMNNSQIRTCGKCGKSSPTLFTYARGESSLCAECFGSYYRKCDCCNIIRPVYGPKHTTCPR